MINNLIAYKYKRYNQKFIKILPINIIFFNFSKIILFLFYILIDYYN